MSDANIDEITLLINAKQSLANSSLVRYEQQYRYLTKIFKKSGDWIMNSTEKSLIKLMDELELKPAGKLNYVNLFIVIKQLIRPHDIEANKWCILLEKFRQSLMKKNAVVTKKSIQEKAEDLPEYEVIVKYITDLYKQKKWSEFLVNELIFTYGLRNKDINCTIIDLKDYVPEMVTDVNFLVVKKTSTELVVNSYKTSKTYGAKNIIIRSRRILNACKQLGIGRLLQKTNGDAVSDTELSYYINLMPSLGGKLTEADYFKINIKYLQSQPNSLKLINDICITRGSCSLNTLNNHYNIDV